ncbi:hypothetical protein DICPUDRAFT_74078 [Dictyostelium purpureum]|uniref:Uncharacterized protein n=1 Tax=Dictyostelium purpureum TaxID=5786 RepID=F0Z6U7_DICPU|nr:uncharacterized protein DICPUDRAFT_74078 [Dictyostelium purpureum]EGC40324.1 hypothetical protein DICPUDRAFT_74078 [Dictyostelium purpureum]|eukprot:XP_003283075.1 hypothetical protein DICPUDRAFT_74078 [Dictyostelium purpureum]
MQDYDHHDTNLKVYKLVHRIAIPPFSSIENTLKEDNMVNGRDVSQTKVIYEGFTWDAVSLNLKIQIPEIPISFKPNNLTFPVVRDYKHIVPLPIGYSYHEISQIQFDQPSGFTFIDTLCYKKIMKILNQLKKLSPVMLIIKILTLFINMDDTMKIM